MKKTQDSCFGTSLMFEALFLFLFFPSGSVFVLDEAFLLQSHIFRVKGWLCALLLDPCFWKKKKCTREMECEVRRGREEKRKRER